MASAQLAWQDAGTPQVVAERGGVIFATGIGGIETLLTQHSVLLEKGPGRVSPFMVPMLMANAPAGHIAMRFGLTGANFATISACSSSNHALFEALRLVRSGTLDLVRRRRLGVRDAAADGRRVRADDGAHEEPRPGDRLAALRRRPRRLRAVARAPSR